MKDVWWTGLGTGDAHGTPSSGPPVVARRRYDAFGNVVGGIGSYGGSFGYAGKFGYQSSEDAEVMLLGHRYYDPSTGRFLTRDPIKDGRNWYAYCAGNPVTSSDPAGTIWGFVIRKGAKEIRYIIFPTQRQLKRWVKGLPEHVQRSYEWESHGHGHGPPHGNFRPENGAPADYADLHVTTKGHADKAASDGATEWTDWLSNSERMGKSSWDGIFQFLAGVVMADLEMAARGFGNAIDPAVAAANEGYKGWSNGGRAGISPAALSADIWGG